MEVTQEKQNLELPRPTRTGMLETRSHCSQPPDLRERGSTKRGALHVSPMVEFQLEASYWLIRTHSSCFSTSFYASQAQECLSCNMPACIFVFITVYSIFHTNYIYL